MLSGESCYWFYIVTGEVQLIGATLGKITLAQGDGLWLSAGECITLEPHQGTVQLLQCDYQFGSVYANKTLNPLLELNKDWLILPEHYPSADQLKPMTQLLLQESLKPRCGSKVMLERLAEAYLVQLFRSFLQHQGIEVGVLAGLSDQKIGRALVAIHDNPQTPWQVASLADQAGMSRAAFSARFKQAMNMPPMHYLAIWRMRIASQRLIKGERNLAILSQELGYQSEAAFRRSFKKIMGVTPGEMAKHAQQKQVAI
ncbi:hypothetical protein GCM10027340_10920 [Marinomonas epiphytica]